MRGLELRHRKLGLLLRQGRERQGLSLDSAAMMFGLTNRQYLWRCESGRANFPLKSLRRAVEVYRLPVHAIVEAMTEDFQAAMLAFLRGENK